jgi:hypothetical protein
VLTSAAAQGQWKALLFTSRPYILFWRSSGKAFGLFDMLGRLLSSASFTKRPTELESSTDEAHTRQLLFPHAHTQIQSNFDDKGGLELDVTRDFRIILAQDAGGEENDGSVLFDSNAPDVQNSTAGADTSTGQDRATGQLGHKRGGSSATTPQSPGSPLSPKLAQPASLGGSHGPFHSRGRSFTLSGTFCGPENREVDTKDATKTFLNCMFGSSSTVKSGSSTKMHIISADNSNISSSVTNPTSMRTTDPQGLAEQRRREPLTRAHTYGTARLGSIPEAGLQRTRDTVLITRMFNVVVPEEKDSAVSESIEQASSEAVSPDPYSQASGADGQLKRKKPRAKKTPAFAASVLIQLPRRKSSSRPESRHGAYTPRPLQINESLSSSYASDLQSSWAFLESMPLSLTSSQSLIDAIDTRIEDLVEHFDVITRALAVIETKAKKRILELLKEADMASSTPVPKPPKEKSMQRTNVRVLRVVPYALADSLELREASLQAIKRIYYALRIPKALTGYGLSEGGPWVEEARYVARFCGGRQQNFFLFNLLTAFLGSHTEWLSLLGPEWYRRRHRMQQRSRQDVEPIVSRTVLLCNDRGIGRRLVFLLASFLPGPSQVDISASPLRPGTAFSFKHSSSQSPPVGHLSRQQSLRRTIGKKTRDIQWATQNTNQQALSTSANSNDAEHGELAFAKEIVNRKPQRADFDVRSIRTTPMLPIPINDMSLKKTSAGTTSTVTPNLTTPVAHFSSGSSKTESYFPPGLEITTPDSFASMNLARHLRRSSGNTAEPGSEQSTASTKWGSLLSGVSGFWSNKQNTTSSTSETLPTSSVSQSMEIRAPDRSVLHDRPRSRNRLEEMADEVSQDRQQCDDQRRPSENDGFRLSPDLQDLRRPKPSTLKMKVDENDGVVDVDIRLPGFLSSSPDSGLGSPQPRIARHTPSLTSLDGFASMQSSASNTHRPGQHDLSAQSNVAGYLRKYHQDFSLQAVKHYPEVEDEVRASMLAELTPAYAPTCAPPPESTGLWVNVCTTLIADVRSFSIKRLSLKRKIASATPESTRRGSKSNCTEPNHVTAAPLMLVEAIPQTSLKFLPEEMITSEIVMDLDITLTDAIERILNRSSTQPSRQPSPTRHGHSRQVSSSTASTMQTQAPLSKDANVKDTFPPVADLPHQESRRMVVNALEEVVKSVNEDLNGSTHGRNIQDDGSSSCEGPRQARHEESALREGVKQWLISVEHTDVW